MFEYELNYKLQQSETRKVTVGLWYPRLEDNVNEVEVDLVCVRAADSIKIRYDFERDGWSVLQASRFKWDANDAVCDPDWQEVAFIQAWAREVDPDVDGDSL